MIDKVRLSESAYFYRLSKPISNNLILNSFRKISSQKKGNYVARVIREPLLIENESVTYSLCIYGFEQAPTFLVETTHRELKYAYIMLIEYKGYLVISKKNVSGFGKIIKGYIENLDYSLISKLMINEDTCFEKLSMNNMDLSDNVIRKKYVEAIDLKNSLSTVGANRSIINNMRISEDGERYALSLNTSRINKLGAKADYSDYIKWSKSIVDKIQLFEGGDNFVDHFATPLKFEESISSLSPSNILILLSELKHEDIVDEIYIRRNDKKRSISVNSLVNKFEKALEITETTVGEVKRYIVKNNFDNSLRLRINKTSITLTSSKMHNVIVKLADGTEIDLIHYINSRQDYIICFKEVDTVYRYKKLFKDSELIGNLEAFLSVFNPFPELADIESEKGHPTEISTSFDSNCLFGFVEEKLINEEDYIICDDLGNEWADHISVRVGKSITYLHSKHGQKAFSASNFHEVVGQAQKNIGNMFLSKKELERKVESWKTTYNAKNTRTSIQKIRRGDPEKLVDDFLITDASPNIEKIVYLVVDFISKSELETELEKLKEESGRPKNEAIQVLWLLSSLVSVCLESGIKVYISCLP